MLLTTHNIATTTTTRAVATAGGQTVLASRAQEGVRDGILRRVLYYGQVIPVACSSYLI